MNNENPVFCPLCHTITSTRSVTDIYFGIIEKNLDLPNGIILTKSFKQDLFRNLAPPSASRQPIWFVLRPDVFFGALMLIFLFSALFGYVDGKITLLNATAPIVLLTIIYLLLRKRISSFYEVNQQNRVAMASGLSAKANEWSNSFYCFHDACIYHYGDENTYNLMEFHQRMHNEDDLTISNT